MGILADSIKVALAGTRNVRWPLRTLFLVAAPLLSAVVELEHLRRSGLEGGLHCQLLDVVGGLRFRVWGQPCKP